jgi:transposase
MLPLKVVPHLEQEELEELVQEEDSLKQARRYLAILQAYRTNYYPDCKAIADFFLVSRQTVYNWIKAWNREGLEGIQVETPPGRPETLNEDEQEQLFEVILRSPRESGYQFSTWTLSAISEYISERFDEEMTESGIWKLLTRNDIVQVKPRPMPAKGDPKKNANSSAT